MDVVGDLQEPDEARPAKRMRLDAPLAVTEETQDEIVDDDDWDDVYDTAEGKTEAPPSEPVPHVTEPTLGSNQPSSSTATAVTNVTPDVQNGVSSKQENQVASSATGDGVPIEAVAGDPDFITAPPESDSTNDPSQTVLEQTSDIVQEMGTGTNPANTMPPDSQDAPQISNPSATDVASAQPSLKPQDDPDFMAAAQAQKQTQNPEWQFDSSDAESSSGSDSTDSDDDSDADSDSEGGYEMLDPATAAKMLMSGDDDDGDGDKGKKAGADHQPRTTNEIKETVVVKPDVVVTQDMKITLLGVVESTVENMILIKGATPGEYQVLESGSVLCDESRTVIGAVAETFGRVQEPMYSVACTNEQEITDAGLQIGTRVFYVDTHSTFVFTQPLRNLKGTDASNIHDEEVGEDEMEFSDDEAEAEYKRQRKLNKRAGRGDLSRGAFTERHRASAAHDYNGDFDHQNYNDAPTQEYGNGLSYDDAEPTPGEEFYQPLKRPENLSSLMSGKPQGTRPQHSSYDRGRGRGRGDFRGRGRGDRGRGRGGFDRGGHPGTGSGRSGRGGPPGNQQSFAGHRGSAHSFPDRHNSSSNTTGNGADRPQHSLPPRPQAGVAASAPVQPYQNQAPAQQYQYAPPVQYQQQPPQQYQFNGYTFQYGQAPAAPQYPAHNGAHQQPPFNAPPQPHVAPVSAIPPGAHVNPAFYPQFAQAQQPAPQPAWSGQPAAQQQFPPATNNQPTQSQNNSNPSMQAVDLGDILKRLSNAPRK